MVVVHVAPLMLVLVLLLVLVLVLLLVLRSLHPASCHHHLGVAVLRIVVGIDTGADTGGTTTGTRPHAYHRCARLRKLPLLLVRWGPWDTESCGVCICVVKCTSVWGEEREGESVCVCV